MGPGGRVHRIPKQELLRIYSCGRQRQGNRYVAKTVNGRLIRHAVEYYKRIQPDSWNASKGETVERLVQRLVIESTQLRQLSTHTDALCHRCHAQVWHVHYQNEPCSRSP